MTPKTLKPEGIYLYQKFTNLRRVLASSWPGQPAIASASAINKKKQERNTEGW
jgi:hypothetical protein